MPTSLLRSLFAVAVLVLLAPSAAHANTNVETDNFENSIAVILRGDKNGDDVSVRRVTETGGAKVLIVQAAAGTTLTETSDDCVIPSAGTVRCVGSIYTVDAYLDDTDEGGGPVGDHTFDAHALDLPIRVFGSAGEDSIQGGTEDDTFYVSGEDTVSGGDGNDAIVTNGIGDFDCGGGTADVIDPGRNAPASPNPPGCELRAPYFTAGGSISGAFRVGSPLSFAAPGTSSTPFTLGYSWYLCDPVAGGGINCPFNPISPAATYTPAASDVGKYVYLEVVLSAPGGPRGNYRSDHLEVTSPGAVVAGSGGNPTDPGIGTGTDTFKPIVDVFPAVTPTPTAEDTTKPTLRVPSGNKSITASKTGVVPFVLGPATEDSTGTITLTTTGSARAADAKVRKLGSKSFRLRKGKKATVKVKLSKRGRKTLKRKHKLTIKARIVLHDKVGNTTRKSYASKLVLKRSKRGRRSRIETATPSPMRARALRK